MNERNCVEKAGIELRSSERERTLEREKIGGELARLTERKDVMVKEYDDVIRQLYDEYQLTKSEAENIATPIEKPAEAKKMLAETKSKIDHSVMLMFLLLRNIKKLKSVMTL